MTTGFVIDSLFMGKVVKYVHTYIHLVNLIVGRQCCAKKRERLAINVNPICCEEIRAMASFLSFSADSDKRKYLYGTYSLHNIGFATTA